MSPIHGQDNQDGQDEQMKREQDQGERTGAQPEEILRDGAGQGSISDEEAVLAYNANAEDGGPDPDATGEE
ncbi:MAG: hypothetical protein QJR09_11485 [Micrococcus sp.]|nr:hypothetical protein [Micrococcus sp.]